MRRCLNTVYTVEKLIERVGLSKPVTSDYYCGDDYSHECSYSWGMFKLSSSCKEDLSVIGCLWMPIFRGMKMEAAEILSTVCYY